MSCIYKVDGHIIGGIKEFNDFLLKYKTYSDNVSDLVFSKRWDRHIDCLKNVMAHADELNARYQEAKKKAEYVEGEELLRATRPYIGFSEFFKGQKNEKGDLMAPEFRPDDYWANRYMRWAVADYTDDEIQEFFGGDKDLAKSSPVELGNPITWKRGDTYIPGFGTSFQNDFRKQMTKRWKMQALYGTAIHNVLQTYFSKTKEGNFWYDLINDEKMGATHLKNLIDSHTKRIVDPEDTSITYDGLSEAQVKEVLNYAKQLREAIVQKYGKGDPNSVKYYPEFTLSAKLNKTFEGRDDLELLGRVDLLILDSNGTPHIIDYKTSPHVYDDYKDAKKLTFTYQLGSYERMLRRAKLNTTETELLVAPLQMEGFRKEGDKYVFSHVKQGTTSSNLLESLNERIYNSTTISANMDEYLQAPMVMEGDTDQIITKTTQRMAKLFPTYGDARRKTDSQIRKMITDQLGEDWINHETGYYEYHPYAGESYAIRVKADNAEAEVKFFEKVKSFYVDAKARNVQHTIDIKKVFIEAQEKGTDDIQWPNNTDQWFVNRVSKYLNGGWRVLDGEAQEAAQQFGMILMYNEDLNVLDVVKISSQNLHYQNSFGANRENLTGGLDVDDNLENTKSSSLMLKATNGNIEMIEAMTVLNNIRFGEHEINLGNITVLTPKGSRSRSEGLPASNKELKYSWDALNKLAPMEEEDNFNNGYIHMLSSAEQCYFEFKDIMARVGAGYNNNFQKFEPAITQLHNALALSSIDRDMAIAAVKDLLTRLEGEAFGFANDVTTNKDSYKELPGYIHQNYAKILYQQANKALLELSSKDVRQMVKSDKNYISSWKIWKDGLSGLMIDNPGQFGNAILNQMTSIVLEGYQNARDIAQGRIRTLRNNVEELKKKTGYSGVKEMTYGNQSELYDKMTYYTDEGDLLFVNPWKKDIGPGTEFLKYAILQFNKDSHPDWTEEQIQEKIRTDNIEFFQVPIIESTFASHVNQDGWGNWLKHKFRMFKSVDALKEHLKDKASEFFTDDIEQEAKDKQIFDVVNMMDQCRGAKRIEMINTLRAKKGDGCIERNLENLLGTHIWAYATHNSLKDRMPLLKAAYISIAVAANEQNYDYENEKEFYKKFVQNRVNHISIMDEQQKMLKSAIAPIQQAASWAALAFSPVQFTYQSLEGIWKDCKLIFTKPDGTEAFTKQNMKDAVSIVYKELGHYSDKATVPESLNAFYGINDMDASSFAQNNSSDNHGIFNFFGKFAYKFSSRPDFYNRMSIFTAQMLKDGSYKAHKIDKDGQLVYNWKEDERFKAYAKNDHSNEEAYQKAKSMYYTVAQQLIREGVRHKDGTLFKMGDDLPKAYSNQESESMKAIGDNMYGYYDSTKKSMFQGIFMGSLLMQMQTYWSAKKNQYLGKGGHKVQGEWRIAKDPEGNDLYYSKNESGEIDINGPLVTKDDPKCSGTQFMQWHGKFEEGILVTLWDMAKLAYQKHSLKDAWNEKWNNADEDMRKTYQSNLKSLFMDMLLWILIGGLSAGAMSAADDLADEAKQTKDAGDAASAAAFGLLAKSLRNSSLDFMWWDSIFKPTIEWQPFSFGWAQQEYENISAWVTGDASFFKTVGKSFGAARNIKPIFTYLDQQTQ